jgi:hypothetical protein
MASLCVLNCWALAQTPPSTNRSRRFGPDACGPVDPSYIHAANETGGQPMFLQPSETAKSFHLVRESTRSNVSKVLWATGTLEGREQSFDVPVDSATRRITFSLSGDTKGTKLTLTRPSGRVVVEANASTENTELNCGRIVTVSSPEPGTWKATIAGAGRYWIQALAESAIFIISAEFVKKGGRPGHEGLFKISGEPLAGIPATLEVSLMATEVDTTEFRLVTERGDTILLVPMQAVNSDRGFLEFVGSVELPAQPFRVAVMGRDSKGQSYQRFHPGLFHAQTVEVLPDSFPEELPVGKTTPVSFTLRNIGSPSTFKITVTDSHRFVSQVLPPELTLGTGESGKVRVELNVPAGTAPGGGDVVVVVANSTAGSATSNSAVLHLSISAVDAPQNPR